jgi:alpha-tubulin suppressor-like RCC1 family protein
MGKHVTRVSCGHDITLAVTDKGHIFGFGDNSVGQLGQGHTEPMTGVVEITALADLTIIQAEAGWTHTLAMDDKGVVYGWGDNSVGQLGLGHKQSPIKNPTAIDRLRDKGVYFLATGYFHSFVLTDSGLVYAFGSNDHGQLGIYDKYDRDIPVVVPLLSMRNVTHISAGATHTIVATGNNRAYTFGSNVEGQLGTATFEDQVRPIAVEMENKRVFEVLAGYQFTLMLAESCTELPVSFADKEQNLGTLVPKAPPQAMLRAQ